MSTQDEIESAETTTTFLSAKLGFASAIIALAGVVTVSGWVHLGSGNTANHDRIKDETALRTTEDSALSERINKLESAREADIVFQSAMNERLKIHDQQKQVNDKLTERFLGLIAEFKSFKQNIRELYQQGEKRSEKIEELAKTFKHELDTLLQGEMRRLDDLILEKINALSQRHGMDIDALKKDMAAMRELYESQLKAMKELFDQRVDMEVKRIMDELQ